MERTGDRPANRSHKPHNMSILLKNIGIGEVKRDILVEGDIIKKIRPAGEIQEMPEEAVDCTGRQAVPGFINMHTHAAMSLMRGIGEDILFSDWLNRIWDVESRIDEEYVYWGTKAAALEMIRTGTTTFNDHYWHSREAVKAAEELGIRPIVSYVLCDRGDKAEAERQKEECIRLYEESLNWKGRAIFSMSAHAIYSVQGDMIAWAAEFARNHGLNFHIHVSETRKEVEDCKSLRGISPVEYLDRLGALGPETIAAHTLWISENDVKILGDRKVNCVHNINSNTKLSSGYRFLYNELRDAGANICIGTDGCASSNNLDMLEAMKTSALFQKAWRDDPKAMPIDELMQVATVNGARALGLNSGKLEEGAQADILIVDTDNTFFLSPGTFLANFIYSAHSDCIESVMAGGRFVMKDKKIEGEKEILHEARKVLRKLQ